MGDVRTYPRERPARGARVAAVLAAALVAGAVLTALTGGAGAASSGIVVDMTVRGATEIDASGCATGGPGTTFGTVLPGDIAYTSADCTVSFGSSNDVATLHVFQQDGRGAAMHAGRRVDHSSDGTWGGVVALDDQRWVVAGTSGDLAYTFDGGETFSYGAAAASDSATDLVIAPDGDLWEVASSGAARWSADEGRTWTTAATGTAVNLESIAWADAATGWIVGAGGTILKTTDGGVSWTPQGAETEDLKDVVALSASEVLVAGRNATVVRTLDGGTSWSPATVGGTSDVYEMAHLTGDILVAAGLSGQLMYSSDRGANWTLSASSPGGAGEQFRALVRIDGDSAVAAGTGVGNWVTDDAGVTWSQVAPNSRWVCPTYAMTFLPGGDLVQVGADSMCRTPDLGVTWRELASGREFRGATTPVPDVGWVMGTDGYVARTDDGGQSWTAQEVWVDAPMHRIDAASSSVAWMVGADGTIMNTADGGATWTEQVSGTTATLWGVAAGDASTAWAVGANDQVWTTTDGGATPWTTQATDTAGIQIWEVDAIDASTAWAVGASGHVLKFNGATWDTQSTGAATLRDVSAVDANTAWAAGNGGYVVRTVDGTSWSPVTDPSGATTNMRGIVAFSASEAIVTGYSGQVWHTADGGSTWSDVSAGDADDFEVVAGWSAERFIVGGLRRAWVLPFQEVADYDLGTADFTTGTNVFGACLRAVSAATADWTTDANAGADCVDGDADPWNAIPQGPFLPGATVAHTTVTGEQAATASLRFGVRADTAQAAGSYAAPITFQVTAPAP